MRQINIDYQPIEWLGDRVRIIDQTQLPHEEVYLEIDDYRELISAIADLKIRGAPAIGVAGAYAVVLGALGIKSADTREFLEELNIIISKIASSRPTARNLFFSLERMSGIGAAGCNIDSIRQVLLKEAIKIHSEEAAATELISQYGAELIEDGWTILTHCNTGPLATSGRGTALGVIIKAGEQGKNINVFADETRPLLQGARLTTWELQKTGLPVTLITDSTAGHLMSTGRINCVITGADRIAANGDAANKIGTYALAVLAHENNIPFYLAAPTSTIDLSIRSGREIPIEERQPQEITHIQGVPIAPEGVNAINPAFDVTPQRYITAIITEKGIIYPPYAEGIQATI